MPKVHKYSLKQRYIAGSAKCSTKSVSKLLTYMLSAVKMKLQSYCDTGYSRYGANQIWILKNSIDLFFQLCVFKKNGQRRYKCFVLVRDRSYCVKNNLILLKRCLKLISSTCSSFWLRTYLLCSMDVFFNRLSAYIWVQIVLLFLPTCSFIRMIQISHRGFSRKNEKKLTRFFNFTFCYIDDVLSLNNYIFGNFVDCIFPIVVEIKDVTDTDASASYFEKWRLRTKFYDK